MESNHQPPRKIALQKIAEDNVQSAVFKALDAIEARPLFAKPNCKVLLKPNLLSDKPPERAVTTHPLVVQAVIEWIKQVNPGAEITVGDSSGGSASRKTEQALQASGILDVCQAAGVTCLPLEKTERKVYQIANPLVLKEFASTVLLDDVDVIVNLPKIKTHELCTLTCCIKNMFGTVLLANKPKMHARFTTVDDFCSALVDIYSVSKPQLTVVDGYLCQEGAGPAAGDVVKLDVILAGYDGLALDSLVCDLTEIPREKVKYLALGEQQGIGSTHLDQFTLVGDSLDSVRRKFKLPPNMPMSLPLPKAVRDYAGRQLFRNSIRIDPVKCRQCGMCWKNCPVEALAPPNTKETGSKIPHWDKNACIGCYCCSELCPYEAITFRINYVKNFLTSWFMGGLVLVAAVIAGLIWLL